MCKGYSQRPVSWPSITAAGQETAYAAKALGKSHRRHCQIKIGHEIHFFMPAVQTSAYDAADQSSVYHPSILKRMKDVCRIGNDFINNGNTEQYLGAQISENQTPDNQPEYLIRIQLQLLCPAFRSQICRNNANTYHQSIAVNSKRPNGK